MSRSRGMTAMTMDLHTAGHRRASSARRMRAAEPAAPCWPKAATRSRRWSRWRRAIAVVYPHMNGIGGDGFWLIREPSGRVRALMAAGAAGEPRAAGALSRAHDVIPSRGPLAALTVPGAIAGWMLALEAAKAQGGTAAARRAARPTPSARPARATPVSRSHARLTAARGARAEARSGLRADLPDRRQAAGAGAAAQAAGARRHARSARPCRARRFLPRRCRARDRRRSRTRRQPGDARRSRTRRATLAEPLSVAIDAGTLYNTPPPTQGLASLIILALFDRLGVKRGRKLRSCARPGRGDQARAARARPHHHRSRPAAAAARALSRRCIPRRRGRRRSTAARPRRGRRRQGKGDTIWMGAADASGLVVSYIQSLYWEFGSGVVLPRTGVLMQNRGTELLARPRRAQCAGAGAAAAAHAQSGAGGAARRPRHGLRHHGRRRAAADPGGAVHPPRALPPAARRGARSPALARSAAPGARRTAA